MNWSLSFISLLLYMYLSCRENWIRCDESRHHSSLPVKLIFILKVNKYSLLCGDFWYSFLSFLHSLSSVLQEHCVQTSVCTGHIAVFACLLVLCTEKSLWNAYWMQTEQSEWCILLCNDLTNNLWRSEIFNYIARFFITTILNLMNNNWK